jgi:hypothetical protein
MESHKQNNHCGCYANNYFAYAYFMIKIFKLVACLFGYFVKASNNALWTKSLFKISK